MNGFQIFAVIIITASLIYLYKSPPERFTPFIKKYESRRNPLDIYYKDDSNRGVNDEDSCGLCSGMCDHSTKLKCDPSNATNSGDVDQMTKSKYIYIKVVDNNRYLGFDDHGTKSNVFTKKSPKKRGLFDPQPWEIVSTGDDSGSVYIRSYSASRDYPNYYLASDAHGNVTTSLFKGSYNQRWIISDSQNADQILGTGYNIISAAYDTYLGSTLSGNIGVNYGNVFTGCNKDSLVNWTVEYSKVIDDGWSADDEWNGSWSLGEEVEPFANMGSKDGAGAGARKSLEINIKNGVGYIKTPDNTWNVEVVNDDDKMLFGVSFDGLKRIVARYLTNSSGQRGLDVHISQENAGQK